MKMITWIVILRMNVTSHPHDYCKCCFWYFSMYVVCRIVLASVKRYYSECTGDSSARHAIADGHWDKPESQNKCAEYVWQWWWVYIYVYVYAVYTCLSARYVCVFELSTCLSARYVYVYAVWSNWPWLLIQEQKPLHRGIVTRPHIAI